MKKKIAVVDSKSFGKYFPEHLEMLNDMGGYDYIEVSDDIQDSELAELLQQYEYIIASVTPDFNQEFFEKTPNLKLMTRHGLGYNNIDVEAAGKHGVYVTKVNGIVERQAVAEHTLSLILSTLRWIPQADKGLRNNPWEKRSDFAGKELRDLTVGIIGLGNIGSGVGEIISGGFKTEVIAYDPYKDDEYMSKFGVKKVDLDTLLTQSDVISLNPILSDETFELIDAKAINKMKNDVTIINTARGAMVNFDDLIEALEGNHIRTYAADVFHNEPIEEENALKKFPNVILTPHIGAYTDSSLEGMGLKVVKDVELMINGEKPKEIVNEEYIK